jgi:hypothetical protein
MVMVALVYHVQYRGNTYPIYVGSRQCIVVIVVVIVTVIVVVDTTVDSGSVAPLQHA